MALWDALGFLLVAFSLGAFVFWLIGYFAYELIRQLIQGPSEQLQSVGTSILDETPLASSPVPSATEHRSAA